jgi:hypothetical protein
VAVFAGPPLEVHVVDGSPTWAGLLCRAVGANIVRGPVTTPTTYVEVVVTAAQATVHS